MLLHYAGTILQRYIKAIRNGRIQIAAAALALATLPMTFACADEIGVRSDASPTLKSLSRGQWQLSTSLVLGDLENRRQFDEYSRSGFLGDEGMRFALARDRPYRNSRFRRVQVGASVDTLRADVLKLETLGFSTGLGLRLSTYNLIGMGIDIGLGTGISRMVTFEDVAFSPMAEINANLYIFISRIVIGLGYKNRQVLETRLAGRDFSPHAISANFSVGFSF